MDVQEVLNRLTKWRMVFVAQKWAAPPGPDIFKWTYHDLKIQELV